MGTQHTSQLAGSRRAKCRSAPPSFFNTAPPCFLPFDEIRFQAVEPHMNPGQSNGKCGVKVKWWVDGVGAVNPEQRETPANKGMLKIQIWHSENCFPSSSSFFFPSWKYLPSSKNSDHIQQSVGSKINRLNCSHVSQLALIQPHELTAGMSCLCSDPC